MVSYNDICVQEKNSVTHMYMLSFHCFFIVGKVKVKMLSGHNYKLFTKFCLVCVKLTSITWNREFKRTQKNCQNKHILCFKYGPCIAHLLHALHTTFSKTRKSDILYEMIAGTNSSKCEKHTSLSVQKHI